MILYNIKLFVIALFILISKRSFSLIKECILSKTLPINFFYIEYLLKYKNMYIDHIELSGLKTIDNKKFIIYFKDNKTNENIFKFTLVLVEEEFPCYKTTISYTVKMLHLFIIYNYRYNEITDMTIYTKDSTSFIKKSLLQRLKQNLPIPFNITFKGEDNESF